MIEEAQSLLRGDCRDSQIQRFDQSLSVADASLAQYGLDLGESLLDRVQIRRVSRLSQQVQQLTAGLVDEFADTLALVSVEIVHHHDLTGFEGRS